jgi:hypothetical protein
MCASEAREPAAAPMARLSLARLLYPAYTPADEVPLAELRDPCVRAELSRLPAWARAQAWKLLLGYLPKEKQLWKNVLKQRRDDYVVRVLIVLI